MDFESIRREYEQSPLNKSDLELDPFDQFSKWFKEALEAEIVEANAMAVATSDKLGRPSLRMVLLKIFNRNGFVFFTDSGSRKATELKSNPKAALLFFWKEIDRQIIIEGDVLLTDPLEGEEYFRKRPRKSQLAAWASKQGTVLSSRDVLDNQFLKYEKEFSGEKVPTPPSWQGYRLVPHRFEFWKGREDRLHDRFQYILKDKSWIIQRLSP